MRIISWVAKKLGYQKKSTAKVKEEKQYDYFGKKHQYQIQQ